MDKSKNHTRKATPQWQLERMQMLIAAHWDEMWKIVNLRVSSHDRNYQ